MPIYEYECPSCQYCFEIKQSFHDAPVAHCPRCQGQARRVLRSVPIIFKGSGFYVTDNRKGNAGETESGKEKGEKKVDMAKETSASQTKD